MIHYCLGTIDDQKDHYCDIAKFVQPVGLSLHFSKYVTLEKVEVERIHNKTKQFQERNIKINVSKQISNIKIKRMSLTHHYYGIYFKRVHLPIKINFFSHL